MVENNLTSKVIVQNARVLSYGGDAKLATDRVFERGRSVVKAGNTVTLEASPGDSLKIQTAKQLGNISLLMRAPEDESASPTLEVNRNQIDGGSASKRSAKKDCTRGVMRIEGKEYIIDCDGSIGQIADPEDTP